jgi:hypothetical protein
MAASFNRVGGLEIQVVSDSDSEVAAAAEAERRDLALRALFRARWQDCVVELRKCAKSGCLDRETAGLVADAIESALAGRPPSAWVSTVGTFDYLPMPAELMAIHYVEAVRAKYIDDSQSVPNICKAFGIHRSTYDRWRRKYRTHPLAVVQVGQTISKSAEYWEHFRWLAFHVAAHYRASRRKRKQKHSDPSTDTP